MIVFLLTLIFIAAALSLISYVYCWQDIQRGQPHIISLRQITGIMDRNRITRLFGAPKPGYYYTLTPAMQAILTRRRQRFFYLECAADAVCAIGAWHFITAPSGTLTVGSFIVLAGLCQGINFFWSMWLVRKWAHQIREEMDDKRG